MSMEQYPQRPVPAVRALVLDSAGRVLLLKRANTGSGAGAWCLPGGKVDYGQTVEQAVVREVLEETALEVTASRFFFYQDSLPEDPDGMHCINFYFVCQAIGKPRLNEESSEYAWIGEGDLPRFHIVFRNGEAVARLFSELNGHGR
ncbi:NUDIX hydrolase [Fundidesulfovibrio agrisoli]|uniref:NUDIX hydrolase n=1 Tax=Fundidesulfovibrio agrisoli TaxID=2922717 RepID=UPI001FACF57B|nr:NUDIX domain-containing protein [Fundidesulfovibrio agrisoli]